MHSHKSDLKRIDKGPGITKIISNQCNIGSLPCKQSENPIEMNAKEMIQNLTQYKRAAHSTDAFW